MKNICSTTHDAINVQINGERNVYPFYKHMLICWRIFNAFSSKHRFCGWNKEKNLGNWIHYRNINDRWTACFQSNVPTFMTALFGQFSASLRFHLNCFSGQRNEFGRQYEWWWVSKRRNSCCWQRWVQYFLLYISPLFLINAFPKTLRGFMNCRLSVWRLLEGGAVKVLIVGVFSNQHNFQEDE